MRKRVSVESLRGFGFVFLSISLPGRARRRRETPVRRAVAPVVRRRPVSVISRIDGSKKCSICLGIIKSDLITVECNCGASFHNSCAARVGKCPLCGEELKANFISLPGKSEPMLEPIKPMPISRDDRLFLLEDRLLTGEIGKETYEKLKAEIVSTMPEPAICANCGRKLYPGERCSCMSALEMKCPECGKTIPQDSQFCRHCGVILSDDFSEQLYQCTCGRIVTAKERFCTCGAKLMDRGDKICDECGHPVPPLSESCPNCGRLLMSTMLQCPSCGKEVRQEDFDCECGAIFEDRIERIECPECSAEIDADDQFCKSCGVQFKKDGFTSFQKGK